MTPYLIRDCGYWNRFQVNVPPLVVKMVVADIEYVLSILFFSVTLPKTGAGSYFTIGYRAPWPEDTR